MARLERKSFDTPEETRTVDKGNVDVVNLGDGTAMRARFEPGWRWSESVKPIAGTDSCQIAHLMYVVSGRLHIVMDDGAEAEFGPGEVGAVAPGHDAWVVGQEPFEAIDFQGGATYARPRQ